MPDTVCGRPQYFQAGCIISPGKFIFAVWMMNNEWFAVKVRGESLQKPPRKYIVGRHCLKAVGCYISSLWIYL